MPYSPGRPCRHPGCAGITKDKNGYCPLHKADVGLSYERQLHADWYHKTAWRKLREYHLRGNPLCVGCGNAANHVDHIKPFNDWQEFTDPDNLQSLCTHCHAVKSAQKGKEKVY
jgi:5-methylcytosine-specific restriction enzyme A